MAQMYYDKDADAGLLKEKKVAIIGYGIQGRAQGLNLRDSGVDVVVADLPGSPNWKQAEEDGFSPVSTGDAVKQADIVQILTQDHVQAADRWCVRCTRRARAFHAFWPCIRTIRARPEISGLPTPRP